MPITPVQYQPRPYVRGGTIGELIRLRGRNQAEAHLRSGDISAQLWANLGNQLASTIQGYAKERQEAPIRAQEAESRALALQGQRQQVDAVDRLNRQDTAFMALMEKQPNPDAKEVISIYGPQRGIAIAQGIASLSAKPDPQDVQARGNVLRDRMLGLSALSPELRAQVYPSIRQRSIEDGLITPDDAPEQFDEAWWTTASNFGQRPERTPTREIRTKNEDGTETISIVADEAGQTFTSARQRSLKEGDAMVNGQRAKVLFEESTGNYFIPGSVNVPLPPGAVRPIPPQGPAPSYSWQQLPDGTAAFLTPEETRRLKATPLQQNRVPTESERRAAMFYPQMEDALKTLDTLEGELTEQDILQFGLPQSGLWGAFNRNKLSDTGKRYLQALSIFTEARLRPVSGATITPTEYENDRRAYAKQFGETEELANQRRQSRQLAFEGLRTMSGRATTRDDPGGIR